VSRYSDASKAIGWTEPVPPIKFPTLEEAQRLGQRVEAGDWDAFVELFRIYRFAPSPLDDQEQLIMHMIVSLHTKGRIIFEEQP